MATERFENAASLCLLVSCPDPTLSRGKGSGGHWAISWLCRVSSLDTEQPNEVVLHHATMCSPTNRPICSLMLRPHPHLCCTTQIIWLMAFCWLGTTKKMLNGPFHRERVGSGHSPLYLCMSWSCTYPSGNLYPQNMYMCWKFVNMYPSWEFAPLLEICTAKYVPLQEICTPKYVPLLEICAPNETSQVVRILLNNIAPYQITQKCWLQIHFCLF